MKGILWVCLLIVSGILLLLFVNSCMKDFQIPNQRPVKVSTILTASFPDAIGLTFNDTSMPQIHNIFDGSEPIAPTIPAHANSFQDSGFFTICEQ